MQRNTALAASLIGVCLGGGIGAQCRPSDGYSDLRVALARTGVDADASGQAWSTLSGLLAQLQVDVANLAPNTTYQLAVDDTAKASFTTDDRGGASVVLRRDDAVRGLDFDPRGREIEVRHGADDVLRTTLVSDAPGGAAPGTDRIEVVALARSAALASGRAKTKLRTEPDGRRRFSVEVEVAPPGPYVLFVNGTERGSIAAPGGFGEIEFDSTPDDRPHGEALLDFAIEDAQIDLLRGGEIAFSGSLRAGVAGVNRCDPSEVRRPLAGATGEASARLRVRDDCDRDFEVEIERVPAGSYTLFVGGVARGTIVAAFDAARGVVRGEIEFDTDEDEAQELPLTFDPLGQAIEVRAGNGGVFSIASFEAGPGVPSTCTPEETRQDLVAGASQPAASGNARLRLRDGCRSDLSVEIEDVAPGAYDVVIAGAVRATIVAAFDAGAGQVRGKIEFGDDSPGSPPLDFDARGQAIDVVQAGVVVLSTTFVGGGGSGAPSCMDDRSGIALLNLAAPASARAEARLRIRDDCRKTFTVELEDIAAGSYQVQVDGVLEAIVTVGPLRHGEIELDSHDPPKPVLQFDPRGREIAIVQGGVRLFARVFPE